MLTLAGSLIVGLIITSACGVSLGASYAEDWFKKKLKELNKQNQKNKKEHSK